MKLRILSILLPAVHLLLSAGNAGANIIALTPFTERFNARELSRDYWLIKNDEGGNLIQSNGRLNYISKSSSGQTAAYANFLGNSFIAGKSAPYYSQDWEVLCTVTNNAAKDTWIGLVVLNGGDNGDRAGIELNAYGSKKYVLADYTTNESSAADVVKSTNSNKIHLRIQFSKSTKVLTFSYRTSKTKPWTRHSTFSTINGAGATRRGDWKMSGNVKSANGHFHIALYGGGFKSSVASGQMTVDDFFIQ